MRPQATKARSPAVVGRFTRSGLDAPRDPRGAAKRYRHHRNAPARRRSLRFAAECADPSACRSLSSWCRRGERGRHDHRRGGSRLGGPGWPLWPALFGGIGGADLEVARGVKELGATFLRGGASSAHQPLRIPGLGESGLKLWRWRAENRSQGGHRVMDTEDLPLVAGYRHLLQLGART